MKKGELVWRDQFALSMSEWFVANHSEGSDIN